MTGQDIIDDVRSELLEPIPGFWSDAELLLWINKAERDYSNRVRGFEGVTITSTTQGDAAFPLPSNWLSAVAIFYNDIQNGLDSWIGLEATDLQRLTNENRNFLSTDTMKQGTPYQYYIWNKTLYVNPIPKVTGSANLRMYYKSKPVPLLAPTDSINTDDTLADGITAYVLWRAWTKEKEFEMAADSRANYEAYVRLGLRSVKLQALNKMHQLDVRSQIPFTRGVLMRPDDPLNQGGL